MCIRDSKSADGCPGHDFGRAYFVGKVSDERCADGHDRAEDQGRDECGGRGHFQVHNGIGRHVQGKIDRHRGQGEYERDPPAPAFQGLGAQIVVQDEAEQPSQDNCSTLCGCLPTAVEGFLADRSVFDVECRCSAEFAAGRESLQQSGQDDDDGGGHTNGCCGWGNGNEQGADEHQTDGEHQTGFTAGLICVASNDDCAQRTHDERDAERCECQQQGCCFVLRGEEQPGDGDGECAIHDQIEPLESVTDRGGDNGFAGGLPSLYLPPLRHPGSCPRLAVAQSYLG